MDTGENNFLKQFFSRFRNRLNLLYGSEYEIADNITKHLAHNSDHGMKQIGNKFAVVSTQEDVDIFVELMRKLGNFFIIPNHNEISQFVSRVPWFGKRNNFIKVATMGLARLVESGLYARWIKHERIFLLIYNLKSVDIKLNVTKRENYYAMIVLADSQLKKQTLQGATMRFTNLELVFVGVGF